MNAGKTYVQVKPLLPFLKKDEKASFVAEKMSEQIGDKEDATIFNKKTANPDHKMPNIPDLIRASRLKEALEALAASAPADLQADVILLQARYNVLAQSERRNTITQADAGVERAKINEGALELCASVPENPVPEMDAGVEPSHSKYSEEPKTGGKKIFISYSEKDQNFVEEFLAHLSSLKRSGKISSWHSRQVLPGDEKDAAIHEELQGADIILLMLSASFLNTDYIWDMEIAVAMERHERKTARVIPILMKPCEWSDTPFSKLSGLPANGKPVSAYADRDEAWLEVVKGIGRVLDK